MTGEHDLSSPDQFTIGTVGPVGSRMFLLQCRQGAAGLTVKVEKQQVAVLANYLARIVREIGPAGEPAEEELPFDADAEPDWVVGTIGVSYDEDSDRVVVIMEELVAEDEEGEVARVSISREQAAAFALKATELVEAGRPACPLCGLPLDPSGHVCPRTNGHRPPAT